MRQGMRKSKVPRSIKRDDAHRLAFVKNRLSDRSIMQLPLYACVPVSDDLLLEEEIGHLRHFAGRAGDPSRLFSFVMPEKKRERLGIVQRRLRDGDYILTAAAIDGEAAPMVLRWDAHANNFIDPVSGKMLFLLFECYVLLKTGKGD